MNILTKWMDQRRAKRELKKFHAAREVVEKAGFTVCEIHTTDGTDYIVDMRGNWHRIGK